VIEMPRGDATSIAFQVDALTNSDGTREIVKVECEPTTSEESDELTVQELDFGAWEFQFVVPADFDSAEPVFRKFQRYGLSAETVGDACIEAWRNARTDAAS
jgi:hypothetical protein